MIAAAGLTPAWQLMMVFDRLEVAEVNRATETYATSSGKVTNVGLALHHLGGRSCTIGVAGGTAGLNIEKEFLALGADATWIRTQNPTRTCTTLMDRASGETTELVENGKPVTTDELQAYVKTFAEKARDARAVVMSGSLPPGAGKDFYKRLCELCGADTRVFIDARGEELCEALSLRPFLVKPNRDELALTLGRSIESDGDLIKGIRDLQEAGAQNVLISDGTRPAWLGTAEAVCKLQPLEIDTVNPIGCGDCLAAGTAWGLERGFDLVQAARCGVAAAAENATMMLPSRLDPERVLKLADQVRVE